MSDSKQRYPDSSRGYIDNDVPSSTVDRKVRHDSFHGFMVDGVTFAEPYDIPKLQPCQIMPTALIPFSTAVSRSCTDFHGFVHFYEDDVKIERFWNNPLKYLARLSKFDGVISPDYSLYRDFPRAMKIWNTYRNYACGAWLQSQRLNVIANIRLSGKNSEDYALAGAPCNSVIAFGAHGNIRPTDNRDYFFIDIAKAVNILHPQAIVVYGTDAYGIFEYPKSLGIPVHFFSNQRYQLLKERRNNDETSEQYFHPAA